MLVAFSKEKERLKEFVSAVEYDFTVLTQTSSNEQICDECIDKFIRKQYKKSVLNKYSIIRALGKIRKIWGFKSSK